ncbi:SMI1/KNR4 family protein [Rhodococcus sp. BP-349]|uniref:SMI1/KNR4 family protein n=1 Tax=unclassified Rhodococcus (in: high G+C Gram-positive bacteria) TaxID=192944 RepID=UPI001C9A5CD6|nr:MULTISPECIES: SMI1/KNR4 family protein [unclassified Rhodococcus (in: high G+C Gram-positive bacteria)]MBY6540295.1 SMI1/KNR4 family protein [Rhodococcus sp. BP-363]MBY6545680.1 SMI1/KNR4 family protein [Rhodococcus sp. BP-369]MBY6564910.1 SMI1/KNR4 family protein [Rhodococcus sp. BP-370]MBY6578154.1 SMI1/KNR4 family protein [Rhodococcus sp. BP-364]MBY6587455.1 SMI1/KNR4 family protein [Rhodococcus sp. BP-358]
MAVERNLERIRQWCVSRAPATAAGFRSAATSDELDAAQEATAFGWPAQLVQLYRSADGNDQWGLLLGYQFMSIAELLDEWRFYTNRFESNQRTDTLRHAVEAAGDPDVAGAPALSWLQSFLPVARDGDGGFLFVDCRPGDSRGCVRTWTTVERDAVGTPVWDSIDDLLSRIVSAVVDGEDAFEEVPTVVEGRLTWLFDTP